MGPSGVPSRAGGSVPRALARVPGVPNSAIALKRVIITFKKLIQIDGAIGADDLHLAHDIPYALGSVRCVV